MKKQTVIQLKETLSSIPANVKLHLISWLGDNLSDDVDSLIEVSHPTLCCPYCHAAVIHQGYNDIVAKSPIVERHLTNLLEVLWRNCITGIIAHHRRGYVSDKLPKELNAECVSCFLERIIDKESIFCSDAAKWYETFASKHEISHDRLIMLYNQRVIGKEFHIQNVNSYISRLKGWLSIFHGVGSSYLLNYLAWRRLFEISTVEIYTWLRIALRAN